MTVRSYLIQLNEQYSRLKAAAKADISSDLTGRLIHDLAIDTLRFLSVDANMIDLKSLVPGKAYVSFARKDAPNVVCRPANVALFDRDPDTVSRQWQAWWDGKAATQRPSQNVLHSGTCFVSRDGAFRPTK